MKSALGVTYWLYNKGEGNVLSNRLLSWLHNTGWVQNPIPYISNPSQIFACFCPSTGLLLKNFAFNQLYYKIYVDYYLMNADEYILTDIIENSLISMMIL